jgi:hypothetical protein
MNILEDDDVSLCRDGRRSKNIADTKEKHRNMRMYVIFLSAQLLPPVIIDA